VAVAYRPATPPVRVEAARCRSRRGAYQIPRLVYEIPLLRQDGQPKVQLVGAIAGGVGRLTSGVGSAGGAVAEAAEPSGGDGSSTGPADGFSSFHGNRELGICGQYPAGVRPVGSASGVEEEIMETPLS
jgi:hypothetical protein